MNREKIYIRLSRSKQNKSNSATYRDLAHICLWPWNYFLIAYRIGFSCEWWRFLLNFFVAFSFSLSRERFWLTADPKSWPTSFSDYLFSFSENFPLISKYFGVSSVEMTVCRQSVHPRGGIWCKQTEKSLRELRKKSRKSSSEISRSRMINFIRRRVGFRASKRVHHERLAENISDSVYFRVFPRVSAERAICHGVPKWHSVEEHHIRPAQPWCLSDWHLLDAGTALHRFSCHRHSQVCSVMQLISIDLWYFFRNLQIQTNYHSVSMCRYCDLVLVAVDGDSLGTSARSVLLRLLYGGWSGLLHVRRCKWCKQISVISRLYRYMYAKVSKDKYQKVTGNARAAILSGRFIASVIAQLLVSFDTMSLRDLNFLTLGGDF